MDKTPTLRIGERFDRFEIIDVLPAGGMGEMYRAKDPTLQRDVAIKLLLLSEPHDLDRFMREARTAAGFSHPNIVNIFELGTDQRDDRVIPYIVMEFIEGGTLGERMGASRQQVLRWLSEVADGLAALHRRGVLHRDLKPANIMIGNDDRARIVDFGLAKADGTTITTTGTIVGTVDYFSPEQAAGLRLDQRSDIFSFGIVLYEALTGKHPFRLKTVAETVRRIHYESPDRIPGPVGEVVAKCLRKDPENRYLDAADVARDLRELVQTVPTAIPIVTTSAATVDPDAATLKVGAGQAAPTPPTIRSPRSWGLIAGIAMLLFAGVAVLYNGKARHDAERPRQANTTPATVAPRQPAPPASSGLTASPGTITFGGSARLNWSSTNAADAVISPDIGIVGPNGSMDVSPRVTTTYRFVVTNADGIVTELSVTVLVNGAPADFKTTPVTGSLIATPDTIRRKGDIAMLKWNSFDATRVVISPSIGIVPLSGSIQVAPPVTTTYTVTIANDTDSAQTSATVYVEPAGGNATGAVASPDTDVTCIAATQPGVTGTTITDSTSCSVPAHRTVTRALLNYTLDDSGSISVNGRDVFSKKPGVGARDGTITLPVELFAPDKSFSVRVEARNGVNPDGTPSHSCPN